MSVPSLYGNREDWRKVSTMPLLPYYAAAANRTLCRPNLSKHLFNNGNNSPSFARTPNDASTENYSLPPFFAHLQGRC